MKAHTYSVSFDLSLNRLRKVYPHLRSEQIIEIAVKQMSANALTARIPNHLRMDNLDGLLAAYPDLSVDEILAKCVESELENFSSGEKRLLEDEDEKPNDFVKRVFGE